MKYFSPSIFPFSAQAVEIYIAATPIGICPFITSLLGAVEERKEV